jgi:hypothetical protein
MNDILSRMNDLKIPQDQEQLKQEQIQYILNLENHDDKYYRVIGRLLEMLTVFDISKNKTKPKYKIAHKFDNDRLFIIKTKNTMREYKLVITEESLKESYKVSFGCNDIFSYGENMNDTNYSDPVNNIMHVEYKHKKTNLVDKRDYSFTIKYELNGRFINNLRMTRLVDLSNFILGTKPIYECLNDIVQMEPLPL